LNHSLLLSTYYFLFICWTTPNDLKIFKHIDNLPCRMNPKSYNHFGHFFIQMWPSKVQLTSFSHGQKKDFVNSNANILQSRWWKFLKFFPHLFKSAYYKILRLHVSKNVFFLKFVICFRNGSFGVVLVNTYSSQKPLGVKRI